MTDRALPAATDVVIVGGGAGGICAAAHLRRHGIDDFVILERATGVGGVWRANTYPGARCDIPSHFYSFSFALKKDWSQTYAGQAEILGYLEHVARSVGAADRLHPGQEVTALRWLADRARWRVVTGRGAVIEARVVIAATGVFSHPSTPPIPGLDRFAGPRFHSARWDHRVSLHDRRVAVIGTGASAVQVAPAIAGTVRSLAVFQREPAWILPKVERRFGRVERFVLRRVPGAARLHRWQIWVGKELWTTVRARGWLYRRRNRVAQRHLDRQVPDPVLRGRLQPRYPYGCKRLLRSADYLPTLGLPQVELVTEPIERITETGVVTADGTERDVDVLVLCTGFRATSYLHGITVTGEDGADLHDSAWAGGARAYLGMTVPGFPNLFLIYGPNTNVQSSALFMIEQQARHSAAVARRILRDRGVAAQPALASLNRFDAALQRAMRSTVWLAGCGTYFRDRWGRIATQWPYRPVRYWYLLRRASPRSYTWRRARAASSARPDVPAG